MIRFAYAAVRKETISLKIMDFASVLTSSWTKIISKTAGGMHFIITKERIEPKRDKRKSLLKIKLQFE